MAELDEDLKYYQQFRSELWLLTKKFEETRQLRDLLMKLNGKIEMLEELMGRETKKC